MRIYVGCCGFPISRKKYFTLFNTVELQNTFYNPPDPQKLGKLKNEAPEGFKFSMKAWQAITHPPSMRTWRKSRVKIPKELWGNYGYLRVTEENLKAWEMIDEGVKALGAEVVVIQLPPSFKYSEENVESLREFFKRVEPSSHLIGVEVRGDWRMHEETLRELINSFQNVIHVTDPFRWDPVALKNTAYFRLHGVGGKEVNYRYKYSDKDLSKLKEYVSELKGRVREVYVMFNNVYMRDDALRFKELVTDVNGG